MYWHISVSLPCPKLSSRDCRIYPNIFIPYSYYIVSIFMSLTTNAIRVPTGEYDIDMNTICHLRIHIIFWPALWESLRTFTHPSNSTRSIVSPIYLSHSLVPNLYFCPSHGFLCRDWALAWRAAELMARHRHWCVGQIGSRDTSSTSARPACLPEAPPCSSRASRLTFLPGTWHH
jgi:hypothetical protein